ncbi:MAG: hypothetical protein LBC74_06920 [Planctomycetaceae bacterium]|jgi:hypothetical protein|nr:hypothetical protein [Planctomycetaceae bacterium]
MNSVLTLGRLFAIFLISVLLNNNIGMFAAEENISSRTVMTANKIEAEIAPFVDEYTVLVCYVGCVAINKLHKLSAICTNTTKASDDLVGLRIKNVLKQLTDYWRVIETKQQKGYFSQLLESNIDHFYIVFNLKYLHLGAFYVAHSVGDDVKKN